MAISAASSAIITCFNHDIKRLLVIGGNHPQHDGELIPRTFKERLQYPAIVSLTGSPYNPASPHVVYILHLCVLSCTDNKFKAPEASR
ncbi:unnamed protein product [Strongylus vulgaris]|uniref:Uncharacterized protein n=1 Tax=Strongylus vulgaris TaxID=40348 RepID=A0A3P7L9I3_STRVU|nr:unnamed protein product [Strongylus vulgaris]